VSAQLTPKDDNKSFHAPDNSGRLRHNAVNHLAALRSPFFLLQAKNLNLMGFLQLCNFTRPDA
jgi:hypothetical protein